MIEYKSENKLSYNAVTLDYEHLIRAAAIGVRYSKVHLRRAFDRFYENSVVPKVYTEDLVETANDLRIAMDMYRTLLDGEERENVTIVNKHSANKDTETDHETTNYGTTESEIIDHMHQPQIQE